MMWYGQSVDRRLFGGLILALCAIGATLSSQVKVHPVSPRFDAVSAPAAGSIAGFGWGMRQQILIEPARLVAMNQKGRMIRGIVLRRDLDFKLPQKGGLVRLEIRLSSSPRSPAKASGTFAKNAVASPVVVFKSTVVLPNSPAVPINAKPWHASNSVSINFSTPYRYSGGVLCIDLQGRPVAGQEPGYWAVDHELSGVSGKILKFGSSCGRFGGGGNLTADSTGLQIGSSFRLIAFGRPKATPIMVLGDAIRGGLDLSVTGATGCWLYVNPSFLAPLQYHRPKPSLDAGYLNFRSRVPSSTAFLNTSFFVQFAEIETGIARAEWTNPAGFTTTNGLELRVSGVAPSLGMSVIRSRAVLPNQPMPALGNVDVEAAPIMRLLY